MPLLSVILPVYNVQQYLDRCLNSLEPLLNEDIELIIVNDGSTDNSYDIIQTFYSNTKNDNIKIINQKNSGLSAARNSGLKICTGKYIWFIDSDDYIDSAEALKLINFIEHIDTDIIIFGRIIEFKTHRSSYLPFNETKQQDISGIAYFNKALSALHFRTNVWDKVYNHEFINRVKLKFVEGLNYEDMLFNLVAFTQADSIRVFPEYVYIYNCTNNKSITTTYRAKDLDVLQFTELAKDYVNSINSFNSFKDQYYVLIFTWISSCLLNKYSTILKPDRLKKSLLDKVVNNRNFIESAKYCADKNKIPIRVKLLSKLFLLNPYIYCHFIALILKIKAYFKII